MKNAKKNNQVVVAEQVVAKKSAETKPVEKKSKTPAPAKTEKAKKPIEKAVKVAKKSSAKTTAKTAKTAKKAEKKPEVSILDKLFPTTIDLEGEKLERCAMVNSYSDFKKLFEGAEESGASVFVACNWPKKFAKDYELSYGVSMPKGGFENNLDIFEVQFFQQTVDRALVVSVLTEAICTIHAEDVSRNEDGIIVIYDVECEVYISRPAE